MLLGKLKLLILYCTELIQSVVTISKIGIHTYINRRANYMIGICYDDSLKMNYWVFSQYKIIYKINRSHEFKDYCSDIA